MLIRPALLLLGVVVVFGQAPPTSAPDTVQVLSCSGQFVAIIPRYLIDLNPSLQGKAICFQPVVGPNGAIIPAVNTMSPGPPLSLPPLPSLPPPTIRVYPIQTPEPSPSPAPIVIGPEPAPSPSPAPIVIGPGPAPSPPVVMTTRAPIFIQQTTPYPIIIPMTPTPQVTPEEGGPPQIVQPRTVTPAPQTLPSPSVPAVPTYIQQPAPATVWPQIAIPPSPPPNQAEQLHLMFQNATNLQFDVTPPLPVPVPVATAPEIPVGPSTPAPTQIVVIEPEMRPPTEIPAQLPPSSPRPPQTPPPTVRPPQTSSPVPQTPSPVPKPSPVPQTPTPPTPPTSPQPPESETEESPLPETGNGTMNQTITESSSESNATTMAVMNSNQALPEARGYDDDDLDDDGRDPRSGPTSRLPSTGTRSGLAAIPLPNQPVATAKRVDGKTPAPPLADVRPSKKPNDNTPPRQSPIRPADGDKPSMTENPALALTSPPPPHQIRPSPRQEAPRNDATHFLKIMAWILIAGAVVAIGFCASKRCRKKKDSEPYELPTAADRNRSDKTNANPELKTPSRSILLCGRNPV